MRSQGVVMAKTLKTTIELYGKLNKTFQNSFKAAESQAKGSADVIESAFKKAAEVASAAFAGIKVAEFIGDVVEAGSTFEASMSQVAATMGMTVDEVRNGSAEFTKLSDAAKEMGANTMFSASEAADALNYLALAGYNADEAVETLPKVLTIAAAGGLDLAYASDLITDSMAALGMQTSELDTYVDQMARTSQKSNTSVAQLGEATLVTAGMVNLAHMELDEMNTALGVLANNGLKGAEGGTHLRNVIQSLIAPKDKAAKAMARYNITVDDGTGKMKSLEEILWNVKDVYDGLAETEQAAFLKKIFNSTDIGAVTYLINSLGDEFSGLQQQIIDSAGAAEMMGNVMQDNLQGKMKLVESATEGLHIALYECFDDGLRTGADNLATAISKITAEITDGKLGEALDELGDKFADLILNTSDAAIDILPEVVNILSFIIDNIDALIAGIKGAAIAYTALNIANVIATIQGFIAATEGATVAQWLLNAALDANPIGLLVIGITAATVALKAFAEIGKKSERVMSEQRKETLAFNDTIKSMTKTVKEHRESFKETNEEILSHGIIAKGVVNDLNAITDGLVANKGAAAEVTEKVATLNSIYPTLGLAFDSNTNSLNMSTEAINRRIEALSRMEEAEAVENARASIRSDRIELEAKLYTAEKRRAETESKMRKAQEAYKKSLEESAEAGDDFIGRTARLENRQKRLKAEYGESLEVWADAGSGVSELKEQIAELDEEEKYLADRASQYTVPAIEEQTEAINVLSDSSADFYERLSYLPEAARESFEKFGENLIETLSKQMSMFDEYKESAGVAVDQIVKNMTNQIEAAKTWNDNLDYLASRSDLSAEFVQNLAAQGLAGAGQVKKIVEAAKKGGETWGEFITTMDEYSELVVNTTERAQEAVLNAEYATKEATETMTENFEKTKNGIETVSEAIDGAAGKAKGAVESIAESSKNIPKPPVFEAWRTADVATATKRTVPAESVTPDAKQVEKKMGEVKGTVEAGTKAIAASPTWFDIVNSSNDTFSQVQMKAEETINVIPEYVTKVQSEWKSAWEGCLNSFNEVFTKMGQVAAARMNKIIDVINGTMQGIAQVAAATPGAEAMASYTPIAHVAFAKGGTVTEPTYALIGEAGTETVVPHNDSARSRELVNEAVRGVYGNQASISTGVSNNNYNFTFAPVINGASGDVKSQIRSEFEAFKQQMSKFVAENDREVFA